MRHGQLNIAAQGAIRAAGADGLRTCVSSNACRNPGYTNAVIRYVGTGDTATARALAQRYGIQFPEAFWQKAEQSRWRIAVEKGLPPLTVGLIMATALVMSRAADHDWRAYLVTAICTVIFVRTSLNPLYLVAAAGLLGYFGIV